MDYVLEYIKKHKLKLELETYLGLAYVGDVTSLDELDGEQIADIPEEILAPDKLEEMLALPAMPVRWTIQ